MYKYSRRCCLLRVVVDYIKVVYRRIKKCKSMVKSNNPKLQHTNLPKEYIFAWSMSEFIKLGLLSVHIFKMVYITRAKKVVYRSMKSVCLWLLFGQAGVSRSVTSVCPYLNQTTLPWTHSQYRKAYIMCRKK